MTSKKKNLYQILAVAADASDTEIRAAHEALTAKLQQQKDRISAEDFTFKTKVIDLAFTTLSSSSSRHAYDAKLAASATPSPMAAPGLSLAPIQTDAEALSLRAEALAMRADAMTLRADALALKSGTAPFQASRSFATQSESRFTSSVPVIRTVLIVLGTFLAIVIVSQVVSLISANRRADSYAEAAAKANEKTLLQDYYLKHGVRPANMAELSLLEAEDRRKDNEQRLAEREKNKAEQDAHRFEEESRRRGEQVSADLRRAELQAAEQTRREDERKEWQRREDTRVKEQMERYRIERQKAEWREVMRR